MRCRMRTPVAAVALVLLPAAQGRLHIHSGPPGVAGLDVSIGVFAFSPQGFDVSGQLVLLKGGDLDFGARANPTCPPAYRYPKRVQGRLVVFEPEASLAPCSIESIARGAGLAGAKAFIHIIESFAEMSTSAGLFTLMWEAGDLRQITSPPSVDASEMRMIQVVRALDAGFAVTGRLQASRSDWDRMRESPAWVFWRVLVCLHSLLVVELGVFYLVGRARENGWRPPLTFATSCLSLEVLAAALRFALTAVDPYYSEGVLELGQSARFQTANQNLTSGASVLFLIFFAQAAQSAGVASPRLQHPVYRWGFVSLSVFVIVVDVSTAVAVTQGTSWRLFILRFTLAGAFLPLVVVILALSTLRKVQRGLSHLPAPLVARLAGLVRQAVVAGLFVLASGACMAISLTGPWRFYAITLVFNSALNATGIIHADAFQPRGTRVWRGPLGWIHVFLKRGLFVCAATLSRLLCGVNRIAPEDSERRYSANTTLAPHLLLGVTPRFLREFAAHLGVSADARTVDVAALVRDMTRASGRSVAESYRRESTQTTLRRWASKAARGTSRTSDADTLVRTSDGALSVGGRATLFVSHAQSCSFFKLLDAIDRYLELHAVDPKTTYLWLDVMCIRQHEVEADVSHISEIETKIGRVVMVLDPWDKPACLSRVWCLYEVVHCAVGSAPAVLDLAMTESEVKALHRALQKDRNVLERTLASFDARTASATMEADRRMIMGLIERSFDPGPDSDGRDAFDVFNERVRAALHKAIATYSWDV